MFRISPLETLKNASFNWGSILDLIYVKSFESQLMSVSGKDIAWSLIPSGFPACQLIDLAQYFNLSKYSPQFVYFVLHKTENLGISLKIGDNMKTLKKRNLRSQSKDYEGPTIDLENLNETVAYRYFLTISQTKNLETYSDIECKNYPNADFLSFQACDESFVYDRFKNTKIMPFWAAKDLDEVTQITLVESIKNL